ncbi:hypothetical protein HJFPF1_04565 [Paramyrothecium foliicola]|nr:hypothetical protein HJFPF1_04565 [Paramyrothecium foliicola]
MADVYRETRVYRDEGSDDDDRYRSTTVRRYKVNPGRYERSVVEVDDDRRSRYSGYTGRPAGELLEVDRRSAVPDRPRSAFEPYDDRSRSVYYEREVERESPREPARSRVSVYDREADRDWDKHSRHSHGHHHHHHHRHDSDEIRVEKRVEERFEDPHGHEVERYRKETEYYTQADPPPAPVIIRQRAPEQKIIVQEAPPPAPIIVPRQEPGVVVVREKEPPREMIRREPSEEEYWYRHERREVGPHDRDRDFAAVGRYDPRHRHRGDHDGDEDYYVRRTVVRRERSESPHHKRYLAEGALAAAGLTAILAARRDKGGELQENRGRKVLAGAALGALGTEAVRRAHSAYGDRYRDGEESPDRHSMLKKGLGVAAVALAAAGAAKYYQTNKIEKEETHRGRSRRRGKYSGDEYSRSPTVSRSRSRRRSLSTVAKAALGTAATAGIVKHIRDRSKSKGSRHYSSSRSRSRSKSKLRRGAEIAGAAAAAGVATKMWKNHKDKKDARSDYSSDDDDRHRRRYSHSRSRSRSRSQARSLRTDATADPELGLVEYGNDPLPPNRSARSGQGYESEAEERRERRRRRRDRDRSASLSDPERKRSKSRLRDMAAAGAAAIGLKGMKDRHEQDKERQAAEDDARDRSTRSRGSRERRSRDREHDRRRYDEDEEERQRYYTDHGDRPHSPPTASGGAYYPPYPDNTPPAMGGGASLHTFPEPVNHQNYQPYVPQDYTGYPPQPPPGPPPAPNSAPPLNYPPAPPGPPPPGPPPAGGRIPPDHVSETARSHRSRDGGREDDGLKPPSQDSFLSPDKDRQPAARSVTFIPLSPKSSMTMERHRREQAAAAAKEAEQSKAHETRTEDDDIDNTSREREQAVVTRPPILRRRSSDPSSDRPMVNRRPARDYDSGVSDSEEDVELLPARFDDYGRPLDGRATGRHRWTSRQGDFERRARHPGDLNVRGAWQVGGTEGEAVERLARTMTDVIDGRQSWLSLIGGVIGGGLLQPDESHGRHDRSHSRIEDEAEDARQIKHRKRR